MMRQFFLLSSRTKLSKTGFQLPWRQNSFCKGNANFASATNREVDDIQQFSNAKLRPNIYVNNKDLAEQIADCVLLDKTLETSQWIEVNPGTGYLTEALLNKGLPHITTLESFHPFIPYIQELSSSYQGRISCQNVDFFKKGLLTADYHQLIQTILPDIKPREFDEDPPLVVLCNPGFVRELKLFNQLLYRLLHPQDSIYSLGRVSFISIVGKKEYTKLHQQWPVNRQYYRDRVALYSLLFDVETLMEISPHGLYPPPLSGKRVLEKELFIVKVTPKENVFNEVLPPSSLAEFAFFMKQVLMKRSSRLIPRVELLFPGCGPKLIKRDYTMYHTTGCVSPLEFLSLFKDLAADPGYQDTNFSAIYRQHIGLDARILIE